MATPFWQNPFFQMGIGLLSGNQGVTGDAAFRNALASGMGGVLRGQTITSDIRQREEQQKLAKMQRQQMARRMEQQRQLQAAGPQLAAGMLSEDPDVRRQATTGILSMAPQALPQLAGGMLASTMAQPKPTSLLKNLEAAGLTPGTPEYQDAVLSAVMKPQTQINMGPSLPTNYQWVDAEDKTKGVEPIPGSPAEKKTREEEFKLGGVRSALDRYRGVLKKHGAEIMPGPAKSELQTAYFDLMMEMKELFNLGVLQGPDLEIMQKTLTAPMTKEGKWLEFWGGMEAFEGQLRLVDKKLDEARERAKALTRPGIVGSPQAVSAPPPPPGFVEQ